MILRLYTNNSPKNYLNKEINLQKIYLSDITFVDYDLLNPVVKFSFNLKFPDQLYVYNYASIEINNYLIYYYIEKSIMIDHYVQQLTLSIDVLMTYKDQILKQYAIIDRQEKDWNLFLQDPLIQVYENQIIQQKLFPSKMDQNNFILTVAGG